ncbi:dipeptide ABC transporter ATP-binding protein [Nonomuraea gerenzanensis]|uniref:Oligopeptide transport ATP-binding protein OppF (TC 3.A.1.5.1) n=1 Tax=Nonomuraea gerenzanensis TaxID=93944 RepID=A0A1M4EKQ1_9ACTN|nr:ABC transporter ATP-binding protein [Nonomuraea gerenzanensis]UBU10985.1 ABC transporter ATP-binding protein [Nonomuraea gerenzanensis]SBO99439.1 Oligopeptide transport ATP-binding protein OppF (TC 3.A.1.5.1) [Nonomuraea gerenzanensis]
MEEPVLEVSDLDVSFGDVRAVRGVSYSVRRGEVLGIVGESGSGKSVTSAAVMGLLPPGARVSGSVRLHGRELIGASERTLNSLRGRSVSMVFQDPLSALTPVYPVGDQIAEAVRVHQRVSRETAMVKAVELLDLVGIPRPAERALAFPHEFSGGMRQRVVIAMAIANDPDVIICDEPTTALDVTIQAQVLEVLKRAQAKTGAAIVMITHDLGVVAGFADRVLVMYAGRPVEVGAVDDIYYRSRMPYTAGLLGSVPRVDRRGRQPLTPIEGNPPSPAALPPGCPFAPRCPMRIAACDEEEPPLFEVGPGHRAACIRWEEAHPRGPGRHAAPSDGPRLRVRGERSVLEVHRLVKDYPLMKGAVFKRRVGTVQAVAGVSFDIRQGETLGLVGESGSGKTTALTQILELTAPQEGRVVVLGHDTAKLGRAQRTEIRRDMQVVFQDPLASLDPRMTVHDILAEPLRTHGRPGVGRRVRELLALVGLDPTHAARYPQDFSGGQRQRIGIARALALEPRLLVLDEPVSALDVSIQAGVINLLGSLRARLGLSYLFVAHDLAVVRYIADRVAVMYLGRIAELGQVDAVYDHPAHPYTQALLSAIPLPDPVRERARERILLEGDLPSPANPPTGCRFRTRCPKFRAQLTDAERRLCVGVEPEVEPVGEDQGAACHYAERREVV